MDPRLDAAPVVLELARSLEGVVAGLYVGGSLATGDYRPGLSDIDAVALVARRPRPATRSLLVETHQRLAAEVEAGEALHCVYVSQAEADDPSREHWTWAFRVLFPRRLSGVARAELLADPVVVLGPRPAEWLPPMGVDEVREAARAELAGYWTRALRRRSIWLEDVYVDIGLTTWARAAVTIDEGRLITKSEAIRTLADRGVPPDVVDGVARRRAGERVELTGAQREARARVVRRLLAEEIAVLVSSGT